MMTVHSTKTLRNERRLADSGELPAHSTLRVWCWLVAGFAAVLISAEVIVGAALELAEVWEVDQSFIGIAIVGLGTSLPELMISVGAAMRARMAMSVGNLIGSNILDILLPVGMAAVVVPIPFAADLLTLDLLVLLILSLLVLGLLLLSRGIRRPQALLILLCYLGYLLSFTHRL